MRRGSASFALVWLALAFAWLGACVYRPLPLPDGSGGASGAAASDGSGTGGAPPVAAVRLTAPLSTATVTSRRPTLRWELMNGAGGALVQLCGDRACATTWSLSFEATGTSGAPSSDLPAGVVFWRATALGAGPAGQTSPVWEFTVGVRSAPVDTSWGTMLDVNGDGYADVMVGADGVDDSTGQAYLYLGGASGLAPSPSLTLGIPDAQDGAFGAAIASAGDVNGDGYADVMIAAPEDVGFTGRVYVYLGSASGPGSSPDIVLAAPVGSLRFGAAIASAGDVDGDGYADVVVSALDMSSNRGSVYLFLGSASGLSARPASVLSDGGDGNALFGASIAGIGDVNGDGRADVMVGAPGAVAGAGATYLFLGSDAGLAPTPDLQLTSPDDLAGDAFGSSVAGAGDVNGDGYADVVIGSAGSAATGRMFVYVYLGGAAGLGQGPVAALSGASDPAGRVGLVVSGAGDVDGDGYADVAVGAGWIDGYAGQAFVYRGGATGLAAVDAIVIAAPDGAAGQFGQSVAGAGDIDGDGFSDLVVGAPDTSINGTQAGRVYLYRGSAAGTATTPATIFTGPDGAFGLFGTGLASADRASCRHQHRQGRFRSRGSRFRRGVRVGPAAARP